MKQLSKFFTFLAMINIVLGLVSCSSSFPDSRDSTIQYIANSDPNWLAHLQRIQQIGAYRSSGTFGYISPKERFSARFDWHYRDANNYRLKLSSSFSSRVLIVEQNSQGLILTDNKGQQRSAIDSQQLMREIIGIDLPLDRLAKWLTGQPDNAQDYRVAANYRLVSFSQQIDGQNWNAQYLSYKDYKGLELPRDILLKNKQISLKIRIDKWEF